MGKAEGDGEGCEVGAGGLLAGTGDVGAEREREKAQEHAGGEQRAVEKSRRAAVVEPAVEQGVAIENRKKAAIAEGCRRDAAAVSEPRVRPEENPAFPNEAGAQIDVFEPRGHETAVEAAQLPEDALPDRERCRSGLLDLERRFALDVRIARPAAAAVVRNDVIDEQQLPRVGREARKTAELKSE